MRILVIKLSSLGDLFHALPAVHNLKTALNASVDWVTQEEYVDLVKCFTPVDRVIPFHRKTFFRSFASFMRELRAFEYDYIVDLQGLLKSAVVAGLARGKTRIGPSFSREGARLFYSAVAGKRDKSRHAVDENLDVVRYLGLGVTPHEFPVKFPAAGLTEKRPRIAILPVSRWQTKTWPADRFAEVAKILGKKTNATFFLLGGAGERDVCDRIASILGSAAVNMAGKTSMSETGGLLKEMDMLISNDSGPVHMAAAVGTPVLAIFGPTESLRTGPFGGKHCVVRTALPCQPCFSRVCRYDTVRCMEQLTVEAVSVAALDVLEGRGKSSVVVGAQA
jgi:heptosyltransferase I